MEEIEESDGSDLDDQELKRVKKLNQDLYSVVDKKLSSITLIEKNLMDEWRKQ